MLNYYQDEPLEVVVYNPITEKTLQTLCLPIKKKNKSIRGGNLDFFDADITSLREQTRSRSERYESDPSDIGIYPSDTIYNIKYKIYIATGIPIYRQHILYKEGNAEYKPIYSLYRGNEYVPINILTDLNQKTETIMGIAVDKSLYNSKQDINVNMDDLKILLNGKINKIMVVDLYCIIDPKDDTFISTINSDFQRELLYYGFIFKYYPIIPYEGYIQLFQNKSPIEFIYLELKPSFSKFKEQFRLEKKLMENTIEAIPKINKEYKTLTNRDRYYLTYTIVSFDIPAVNIHMFIDRMYLDEYYIFICGVVPVGNKHFMVTKKYNTYTGEILQKINTLPNNTIYIQTIDGIKIYINKSQVRIELRFLESEKITYERVKKMITGIHTYFKNIIETQGKIITKHGNTSGVGTPEIVSSDVHLIWPETILSTDFIEMREYLLRYEDAGMLSLSYTEPGSYHLILKVGVNLPTFSSEYIPNEYAYYTNKDLRDHINSLRYKPIQIKQEASSITILLSGFSQQEYELNNEFILNIIYSYIKNKKTHQSKNVDIGVNTKKLKRLKSIDPDLYDIKRYDKDADVYSIKCQLSRQPVMYRDKEAKNLPDKTKKNLVKFWNFTEKKTAYYHCPSKNYQQLSFMPKSHPLGYCLPCCKKKVPSKDSVQTAIDKECLSNYSINAEKLNKILSSKDSDTHILSYGKAIPIKREGFSPTFISSVLDPHYRLIGVKQDIGGFVEGGLINSIIFLLKVDLDTFIKEILDVIDENTYNMLDVGSVKTLINYKELKDIIFSITIENKKVLIDTTAVPWTTLMTELLYMAYGINLLVINDTEVDYYLEMIRTTELAIITEEKLNEYIIVVKHNEGTFPLSHNILTSDNIEEKKSVFEITDGIIKFFKKVILNSLQCNNKSCSLTIVSLIQFVEKNKNYEITSLLRGKRGYIYAVVLSNKVFIPVVYTEFLSDEYDIEDTFMEKYYNYKAEEVYRFIDSFNKYLISLNKDNVLLSPAYILEYKNKYVGMSIKFPNDTFGHIFNFKGETNIPSKYRNVQIVNVPYDIISVNKSIEKGVSQDPFTKVADKYIYQNNIYNLFLIEFITEIRKNKNKKIRDELETAIKSTRINRKKIRDILEDYPNDIPPIMHIINNYDRKRIQVKIENILFGFDMGLMNKLEKMDKKDRETLINKVIEKRITFSSKLPNNISNTYISCIYDSKQPQCSSNKLVMKKEDYNKCVKDLAYDLDNTYIFETLATNMIGNINPLEFIKHPYETINIVEI